MELNVLIHIEVPSIEMVPQHKVGRRGIGTNGLFWAAFEIVSLTIGSLRKTANQRAKNTFLRYIVRNEAHLCGHSVCTVLHRILSNGAWAP